MSVPGHRPPKNDEMSQMSQVTRASDKMKGVQEMSVKSTIVQLIFEKTACLHVKVFLWYNKQAGRRPFAFAVSNY